MRTLLAQLAPSRAETSRCLPLEATTVLLLIAFVAATYGSRLRLAPLVGEETRWASAAREMLETGDWIVPRQQGQVFPERPPMTMWLMAAVGELRGDVDPIAARLPSVIGIVLTALLIYGYTRLLASRLAAIAAALAYATFGQVLQIGRLGESEAAFALFLSGSLLLWHAGYIRHWRPIIVWSLGFALAALAALVKGPQAPVYFGAIIGFYLLVVRRDWRYLVSWQAICGLLLFAAVVGAWQLPFYRATDMSAVLATWAGLAGDRFYLRGVLSHAVSYPVETFVCLLPWSPLLFALAWPSTRQALRERQPIVSFLKTAIAVAYPTVWLAAGARGRYFMPLYPVVAVLIGLLVEHAARAAAESAMRQAWSRFARLWSIVFVIVGFACAITACFPADTLAATYQPRTLCAIVAIAATAAAILLWLTTRQPMVYSPLTGVLAISATVAIGASGCMLNVNASRWFDPTSVIAEMKSALPLGASLVSLTPIDHRFAYYYGEPIDELPWPRTFAELPSEVDYFCFMRHIGDTAEARAAGRGRTAYSTPGTLPFAWEELQATSVDRRVETKSATIVVLARVIRPLRAEVSDATKPQQRMAQVVGQVQPK